MRTTSWRYPRYAHVIRAQCFRSLGTNTSSKPLTRKPDDHQLKDIVPGDLTATLEAHRRSNRVPFRRVAQDQPIVSNAPDYAVEATTTMNIPESEDVESSFTIPRTTAQSAKESNLSPNTVSATTRDGAGKPQDVAVTKAVSYMLKGEGSKWKKRVWQLAPGAVDDDDLDSVVRTVKVNLTRSIDAQMAGRKEGYGKEKRQGDDDKYKKGSYVPIPRSSDLRESVKPWIVVDRSFQQDRDRLLSAQMLNLSDWLTLTPAESEFRTNLALDLSHGLRKQLGDVGFWLFGSHETGLATVLSDVDLGFYIPSLKKTPGERGPSSGFGKRSNRVKISSVLDSIFISSIWTKRFEDPMIIWARFPLVHMTHAGSRVKIQVVASQPTRVVNEHIRDCLAEYRQLRPIYFLLKTSLAARGLDEPKDGGLGSYSLLNMIIIALKAQKVPRRDSVATALHKVLTFITHLDTRQTGLTTEYPYTFSKRAGNEIISAKDKQDIEADSIAWARNQINVRHAKQDFLLCLQDPNDPLNDLGKNAYQILSIQATLSRFKHAMEAWDEMKEISTVKRTGRPQGPEQLMDWMIGGTCNTVQDRRDMLENWQSSASGRIELERMAGRLKEAEELASTTGTLQGGGPVALHDQGEDLQKAVDNLPLG